MKYFTLVNKRLSIIFLALMAFLWMFPYIVVAIKGKDVYEISWDPTEYSFYALFMWCIYCASAASQYRVLRSLDMNVTRWRNSAHITILIVSLLFAVGIYAAYFLAERAGAPISTSYDVTTLHTDLFENKDSSSSGYAGSHVPHELLRIMTFLSFFCSHILMGYIGVTLGLVLAALKRQSLSYKILLVLAILMGAWVIMWILEEVFSTLHISISAPWPGLFMFTLIFMALGSIALWLLPRRINP